VPVLRVCLAVMLSMATAVVALAQLNLPTREFWQTSLNIGIQWASVAMMAAFILMNEFRAAVHVAQLARIREYDHDLRSALFAALFAVVENTGAPWDEITVCYYRRRGLLRWHRLIRMEAVTMSPFSSNTPSSLRPGEGMAGVAFVSQEIVADDWASFVETATAEGPAAWNKRGDQQRYGLTWGQIRRSTRDHGMIASPTFDSAGDPDGCVVLSGPLKLPDLVGVEMRRVLDDVATTLDRIGSPPAGWWGNHGR
jgi:hypothetical protein